MKISIIVPVYNEENTVYEILGKLHRVKLPKGVTKEIIVVNDGSTDKTNKILNQVKIPGIKIIHHKINLGKGAALRTGFKEAKGEVVTIQDADLEYDPEDFGRLLEPILSNKAKVVYGNRFHNYPLRLWGKNKTVMPTHWLGNKMLTVVTNILFGVWLNDMETCYKLISKEVLDKLDLTANRFDIEPEITTQILKQKIKIKEIPIKVKPRTHSEGKKISWKDGFAAIYTLIKYRFQ